MRVLTRALRLVKHQHGPTTDAEHGEAASKARRSICHSVLFSSLRRVTARGPAGAAACQRP